MCLLHKHTLSTPKEQDVFKDRPSSHRTPNLQFILTTGNFLRCMVNGSGVGGGLITVHEDCSDPGLGKFSQDVLEGVIFYGLLLSEVSQVPLTDPAQPSSAARLSS